MFTMVERIKLTDFLAKLYYGVIGVIVTCKKVPR